MNEGQVTRLCDWAARAVTYSLQRDSLVEVNETSLENLDLRSAVTSYGSVCSLPSECKRCCGRISSHSTEP